MNYTTSDYLEQLTQDRDDLVDNLEAKGITGLTGDETFTELVPEVLNIPSGSTIHGTPINSMVQSGNISKGDFVKRGDFTINDKLSSSNNYSLISGCSISNEQNMFDNDDNTYASVSLPSGNPRIYIQCKSRQELNIPQTAILKDIICNYKIGWSSVGSQYTRTATPVKYTNGDINTRSAGVGDSKTYPNISASGVVDTLTFYTYTIDKNSDTNNYGFQAYSGNNINNKINIYYANFDVYYEYESQIKKVTDSGQLILGIANQDGTQGDTIQVLIPSVE